MNRGFERLKEQWERDPLTMTIIGAIAVGAVAKLINAISAAEGRHAYHKQVNHTVGRKSRYPFGS